MTGLCAAALDIGGRANFVSEIEALTPECPSSRARLQFVGNDGKPQLQDWIAHFPYRRDDWPVEFKQISRNISDLL